MTTARPRKLRPVPDKEPRMVFRTIHGYRRAFRMAGSGPALLLIHGIGDNSVDVDGRDSAPRREVHRDRPRPARPRPVGQAARRLLRRRVRQRHARPAVGARDRQGHGRRPFPRRRRRDAVRVPVPRQGRATRARVVGRRHQGCPPRPAHGVGTRRQRGAQAPARTGCDARDEACRFCAGPAQQVAAQTRRAAARRLRPGTDPRRTSGSDGVPGLSADTAGGCRLAWPGGDHARPHVT